MPAKFDANEFDIALRQFKPVKAASPVASLPQPAKFAGDRSQSDELKVRVIKARTKLKLMRDRSEALRDSLQRFRMQQQSVNRA